MSGAGSAMTRFFLIWLLMCVVSATKHKMDVILKPYEDYFIEAETITVPGRIDFRHLIFAVVDSNNDDAAFYGTDDAVNETDDGGNTYNQDASILIEAVVLSCGDLEKATCLQQYSGIGEQINNNLYICCTAEALAAGACEEQGRLILNDYFDGQLVYVEVSPGNSGYLDTKFVYPSGSGSSAVLFANCNEEYPISVKGYLGFKSSYGYLTVVSWRFSWVTHAMTLIIGGALAWFLQQRRSKLSDHVISATLLLAFLESFMQSLCFIVANVSGVEPAIITEIREFLHGCKYGVGNTLMLLISFGWDQHDDNTNLIPVYTICSLGALYTLILLIPSLRHPAVVGQVLGFMFLVWAVKATTRMIDRFKLLDKEKMSRFTLLRGVFAFSLLLHVGLLIVYCIKWSKSNNADDIETLHRGVYTIRQSVFVCVILSVGIILRPQSEPLLKDFEDPVVTLSRQEEEDSDASDLSA
ncbi:hypothetical protein FisN_2Lh552 [Fistulifera solaris]|uniref:Intimal thickness related receptor IRP domain-containing protein n=1 Tax=Fistulifera solaris TaxID=1519565 RepID=A0A1Z5JAJ4_FISSO|nr:hypothetical protein FisN_2Lh552 [Fistulifera solaris]|eukprot:GAX11023.1 hypothetical protein FisN_2Lh552 [Fistulifera solaris]